MASIPKYPTIKDDAPLLRKVLYAGEGSTTADTDALARAKAMKEQGADDAKIWKETGWYPGKDGKWRSEINDENAKLREGIEQQLKDQLANQESKSYRVRDLLEHDELLKAYPSIGDMQWSRISVTAWVHQCWDSTRRASSSPMMIPQQCARCSRSIHRQDRRRFY